MKLLNLGLCVQCLRLIGAQPQSKQDPFRPWSNRIRYPATALDPNRDFGRLDHPSAAATALLWNNARARPARLFFKPKQGNTNHEYTI
jgi:hypothetical protein